MTQQSWLEQRAIATATDDLIRLHEALVREAYGKLETKGWQYTDHFFLPALDAMQQRDTYIACQPTLRGLRLDVLSRHTAELPEYFTLQQGDVDYVMASVEVKPDELDFGIHASLARAQLVMPRS